MSQSNGNSRKFTIRQQGTLAKLLQGQSITDAARKVGVRRETLHTWMKQPVFLREYHDGCEKLRHEIESKIIMMANKATSVIDQALDAGNTKAALDILKLVNRGRPEIDLSKHQSDAEVDRMIQEKIEPGRIVMGKRIPVPAITARYGHTATFDVEKTKTSRRQIEAVREGACHVLQRLGMRWPWQSRNNN